MNATIKRIIFAGAFALIALVASSSLGTARMPPGLYFVRCENGVPHMYNVLGSCVYRFTNLECSGSWVIRIVLQNRVVPYQPPQQDPPGHPAWLGRNAYEWVGIIRNGEEYAGEPITASDIVAMERSNPPTLTFNELDLSIPLD